MTYGITIRGSTTELLSHLKDLVPSVGIEPTTRCLQSSCSATELTRHVGERCLLRPIKSRCRRLSLIFKPRAGSHPSL